MTISLNEKQLKKVVNTAVIGVLKNLRFNEKGDRVNSPSARHLPRKYRPDGSSDFSQLQKSIHYENFSKKQKKQPQNCAT